MKRGLPESLAPDFRLALRAGVASRGERPGGHEISMGNGTIDTHDTHSMNGHVPAPSTNGTPRLPTVSDGSNGAAPTTGGRGAGGKFAPGNKHGRGNPHARRMAALRQAFLSAATPERLKELGEK